MFSFCVHIFFYSVSQILLFLRSFAALSFFEQISSSGVLGPPTHSGHFFQFCASVPRKREVSMLRNCAHQIVLAHCTMNFHAQRGEIKRSYKEKKKYN
jgi:hypothetical protein